MAFEDTYATRAKKLVKNPSKEVKNVLPFIKSRLIPHYRHLLEIFGNYSLSKPFSDHEDLLKFIDFKNGFFVDCGGNDGYGNDPTYYLEKALGWKGIMVEPLPIYKACKKNRRVSTVYNFAAGSFEDKDKMVSLVDNGGMSFVKGSIDNEKEWIDIGEKTQKIRSKVIEVKVKPVQDLIDDYFKDHAMRAIDLFVADVEGYELNILRGLNFEKNPPKWILIEAYDDKKLKLIKDYLTARRYEFVKEFKHRDYLFKLSQ